MLGYVIVNTEITDEKAYAGFTDRIVGVVETYGGKYLVRGGRTEHKYGEWQPGRVVVIESPASTRRAPSLTPPSSQNSETSSTGPQEPE